ncbi:MAG: TerB N-terminal domain-containing protein [Clostridia bacterium]|nr:TerB N-terminal domain-containing protein [Clostridia bacterium]
MSEKYDRLGELDRFWDLSELTPKPASGARPIRRPHSTEGVEITASSGMSEPPVSSGSGTVLTRYIPPRSTGTQLSAASLTHVLTYAPTESLIHKVILKKWKCSYSYYSEFLSDAIRYLDREGTECDIVPFFSYVPQYNQMSDAQLACYFWFRHCARGGCYLKVDCSYVLLYVFELINLGERLDPKETQDQLVGLWNAYSEAYPGISVKLADWICDYSLIHRLPPPARGRSRLTAKVIALKEFFIPMPRGDVEGCTRSLLRFCNSYDYKTSKFATPENLPLFDRHIYEALLRAVRYYSADGRLLSGVAFEDSRLARDAYAGALCVAEEKYRLEVEYCSFSRSNELRFLIGDLVKYAENKLRGHLGIKSRMTVYSVPSEVAKLLDEYFAEALPGRIHTPREREKQAYEALYDVPHKPLSLSDAARIEEESWSTTRELVDAFETEEGAEASVTVPLHQSEPSVTAEASLAESAEEPADECGEWKRALGELFAVLVQTAEGDLGALARYARTEGRLSDTVAEVINEAGWDRMGDAILEERDGGYAVIEDYREELLGQLRAEEDL